MKTDEQKQKETLLILDGAGYQLFSDFVKEQEAYGQEGGNKYADRDAHLNETIINFFRESGMKDDDYLCWISEGESLKYDGFSAYYIDEGLRLFHGKEICGTVMWCYRGNSGSCWIQKGK